MTLPPYPGGELRLLHRSEKILDGKLSDIKKAYKNNIFNVGLETAKGDVLLKELAEKFDISSSKYNIEEQQLDFTLQLPDANSAMLLSYLSGRANVNHFQETIPSANEIFIQTVQSKGIHE